MSATLAPLVPALDDAVRRGTGCLNVTGPHAGQQAQIYFDDGLVYAVHLHNFTPLIGRRLLSNGSLTGDQYAALLVRASGNEADPAIGVQAVKAGYFRQDVLDAVLSDVLAAAFMDVLAWPTPSTKWKRRARTTHLVAPASQITTLLQAARRRTTQWWARWEAIGYNPAEVQPLAAPQDQDDDPDGTSRLLSVADGNLRLRAISDRCGLTYFEAGQAFLDLHAEGRITFILPTTATAPAKEPAMHHTIPVTHVAPAVDSVPGLPLPPLPNFDGQTLPPEPQAAPVALDVPGPAAEETVHYDDQPQPVAPVVLPVAQPVVSVDFDVEQAFVAPAGETSVEQPTESTEPTGPQVEAPVETQADEPTQEPTQEPTDQAQEQVEVTTPPVEVDPRVSAQRALLADELDAAAEAVRFAESTIARLATEEQAHQDAADQAVVHQQRYEAFLQAAEAEAERLLAEQQATAAEAEALAATAADLTASRATLDETLALVEEQAAAAQRELEEAQRNHEAAMAALAQSREAASEVAALLDTMNAAAEANQSAAARVVEDLSVIEGRTRTYTAEIDEARQSAADLSEAAQASARLRERAEQRLAVAQASLSAKAAELDG
jgi:hypothetical protein